MRKAICGVLICFSVLCSLNTNAKAIEPSTSPEATPLEVSITRATGSFNMSIDANKKSKANTSFPLEAGETVTINASYTPFSASVDFGLIDSKGTFYYTNVTNGSINQTISIEERGTYTLAVRNNSSQTITVSGFVKY